LGRIENATKKRPIRISVKITYWPFRDIAELGKKCLIDYIKNIFGVLLILKLVPSLALAQGLISGLKAHYEFNGNLIDNSGNNFNAQAFGNYSYENSSIKIIGGNSLYYSGGGYVRIPISSMGLLNEFTLSVRASNISTPHPDGEMLAFWGQETNGNYVAALEIYQNSNTIGFRHYLRGSPTGGNYIGLNYAVPEGLDQVHQFVITKSATLLSAFVDGQLVGSGNNSFALPSQANLYLGYHTWTSSSARLNATYQDVQIYDRALTPTEVALLPEPSSLSLLGLGLGGLAMLRRRRS